MDNTTTHEPPKPGQLAGARGSATRWCAIGDTIETTMSNGSVMMHEITNSMACAFANELIASGRWQVSPNAEVSDRHAHSNKNTTGANGGSLR